MQPHLRTKSEGQQSLHKTEISAIALFTSHGHLLVDHHTLIKGHLYHLEDANHCTNTNTSGAIKWENVQNTHVL